MGRIDPLYLHSERNVETLRFYDDPEGYDKWDKFSGVLMVVYLGPLRVLLSGLEADGMNRRRRTDILRYLVGQGVQMAHSIRRGRWITYRLLSDGRVSRTSEPYDTGVGPEVLRR